MGDNGLDASSAQAFHQAQQQGYLVVPAETSGHLLKAMYWRWCKGANRPFISVVYHDDKEDPFPPETASVHCDFFVTHRWATKETLQRLRDRVARARPYEDYGEPMINSSALQVLVPEFTAEKLAADIYILVTQEAATQYAAHPN
jgi:hypothetical protein